MSAAAPGGRRVRWEERPLVLLVGVDFRPAAAWALRHALGLLAADAASAVHVVHVVSEDRAHDLDGEDVRAALAQMVRDVARAPLSDAQLGRVCVHVGIGELVPELAVLSSALGADLVVVGRCPRTDGLRAERPLLAALGPAGLFVAGDGLALSFEDRAEDWPAAHRPRRALRGSA